MTKHYILSIVALGITIIVYGFLISAAAVEKKKNHHHHNRGAHLSVVIDCRHPAIQNSDDAPGWVLVQHVQKLGLNIEVINSHFEKPNLLRAEVVIPIDAIVSDYVVGLCKIEFVVDVSILQKKGVNDE